MAWPCGLKVFSLEANQNRPAGRTISCLLAASRSACSLSNRWVGKYREGEIGDDRDGLLFSVSSSLSSHLRAGPDADAVPFGELIGGLVY